MPCVLLAAITRRGRQLAADATKALEGGQLAINALDDAELAQLVGLLRKARMRAGDFGKVEVLPA